MKKKDYAQRLTEKLIAVGKSLWEQTGSGESIAEICLEAEETETFHPFCRLSAVLALDKCGQELLCVLWYCMRKGNSGIPIEQAEELVNHRQTREPFSPCFWHEAGKMMLSPVTYAYLEGETPRLPEGIELVFPAEEKCYGRQKLLARGSFLLNRQSDEPVALVLSGGKGSGRHFVAEQLAGEYDMLLLMVEHPEQIVENRRMHELLLCMELYEALLCVDIDRQVPEKFLKRLSQYLPFVILVKDKDQTVFEDIGYTQNVQSLDAPELEWKQEIIRDMLSGFGEEEQEEQKPKGTQSLRMRIPEAALTAKQLPLGSYIRYIRNIRSELLTGTFELEKDVYRPGSQHLTLLPANRTFSELKLSKEQYGQMEKICRIIAARKQVLREWGFGKKYSYGNGISVLFYGAPGTGKTMAAQVLANELGMPLLRVDLSQVISKYIGETQKNIGRIFEEAEKCDCILLFDEADAVFAKRSEVSDAQDRYSNAETAYLLQRIEQYDGVSILATNLLQNFDEAFRRRITYMLHFPMPDAALREELWRTILPKETPVEKDVDYRALAQTFELSGAAIKNAALHGAGCAMAEKKPVGMAHLLDGISNEFQKTGKTLGTEQREMMSTY